MQRRKLLGSATALGLPLTGVPGAPRAQTAPDSRIRPGSAAWPSEAEWDTLRRQVGGALLRPRSPLDGPCRDAPEGPECQALLRRLRNPFFLGDEVALTQTSGWFGAWTSSPSAYAVAARHAEDVAAAVRFARAHRLRLVVKGGGHSYAGASNAPDSLLVWTKRMNAIELHDAFVPQDCGGAPSPAVSIGAGAIWGEAYHAVMARAGRYVQGGGCNTVGVAGLVQSGGFGSFSKSFGTVSGNLLEAEVVTADGEVRIANACREPDLFWALKGGGGGTFGVVTRVTLRTHPLPAQVGGIFFRVQARSDDAYRRLVARFIAFYAERLFGPVWGEQVVIRPDNSFPVAMVFQGIGQSEAEAAWKPFLDWIAAAPTDYVLAAPVQVFTAAGGRLWDGDWLRQAAPDLVIADDRPEAPSGRVFWAGDAGQVGQFLHGYDSRWLPASLLAPDRQDALAAALFEGSRRWSISLHMNKGIAGAPAEAVRSVRETAINPCVADAFTLAISASYGPPAFRGMPGPGPDLAQAADRAQRVAAAIAPLRRLSPDTGSYLTEASFFEPDWQAAHWGPHYPRLRAIKRRYDPDGLFVVHHGVGSEDWSSDGFTRLG